MFATNVLTTLNHKQSRGLPRHITHSSTPYFLTINSAQDLASALRLPYRFMFEVLPLACLQDSLEKLKFISADLFLCLSSKTAHNIPLADIIIHYAANNFIIPQTTLSHMQTCLQEAINNAIIHGNLGINRTINDVASFNQFYAELDERMQTADYSQKTVSIQLKEKDNAITLSVTDQGQGFFLPAFSKSPKHQAFSGRGLQLVKELSDQLWLGEDRRTLHMLFHC